jgi:hypothetical protein
LAKSLKCVQDIRDVSPEGYRLPSDGRQWSHVCRRRRELAGFLATFANPDGSSIEAGIKRMAHALGVSTRTINNLLEDLRQLGFLADGKLTGFKGTRRRALKVAAINRTRTVAQSSVSDAQTSVPTDAQTTAPDAQTTAPDTQSSPVRKPESREDCAQPPSDRSLPPPTDSAPENGAPVKKAAEEGVAAKAKIESWILDNYQLMDAISNKQRAALEKLVHENGAVLVLQALQLFANRPSFGGVNNPWMLFLSRADATIAQIKHVEKSKPDEAFIEASIRRQAGENWKRLTTSPKAIGKDGKEIIEADILSLLPE